MYHEGHEGNIEENFPMKKVMPRMEAFCSKQISNRSTHPLELITSNACMECKLQSNGGSCSFPVMSPHSPGMNHFFVPAAAQSSQEEQLSPHLSRREKVAHDMPKTAVALGHAWSIFLNKSSGMTAQSSFQRQQIPLNHHCLARSKSYSKSLLQVPQ